MEIKIGDNIIGDNKPVFIIAEAGVNHNGSIELAKELIDVAKDANANAIKFQTFRTEEIITKYADKADYQKEMTGDGSQFEMVKKLELGQDDFRELAEYAKKHDIMFLSTPFDEKSSDLLNDLKIPAFKISSGDITNHPLLAYVAKKGKPMIISTGMSTREEVREAVITIENAGNNDIVLLHCTSNYPARYDDCNLKAMLTLKKEFNLLVGYSDHTLGIIVPLAAVSMGACIIEKHITVDKNLPGPDHNASLLPEELKEMVLQIKVIEKVLGSEEKNPVFRELKFQKVVRKSIVAKGPISKGTIISNKMIAIKRPGTGLAPKFINDIIGKVAVTNIKKDEQITLDKVSK